jgi:hypothetical protein
VTPRKAGSPAPGASKTVLERYRWPAIGGIALLVALAAVTAGGRREKPPTSALDDYQRDAAVVEAEYRKFHGRLLHDPEVEHQFRLADELVAAKDYTGAIEILERISKEAGVPVIFHNLGSLYSATGDRARAILAFREALARDPDYQPVRDSIVKLKWLGSEEAEPLKREIEPNNGALVANLIAVGSPVEGELTPGDTDSFKFITPPAPRDIVEIGIENVDKTLELGLRATEDALKNDSANLTVAAGESIQRYLSQPPNTPMFLQIWGLHNSQGAYRVRLRALHAFDAYEPNDDIFSARHIEAGEKIDANIMDAQDTDFYVFQSPRTGTLTVDIENKSATLIPALTTFSADRRNSGFGPDVRARGMSLHHTFEAQEHQTYYLQVWPQALSFGAYTLTIH